MKRLPITAKAKMGNTKSPLKFDYRFAKGVADQVAASKEFIAAGDAIGVGIDSSERRIQRQKAISGEPKEASGPDMREFDKAASNVPAGNAVYSSQKESKKTNSSVPKELQSKGGYKMEVTGGKKLVMGVGGVKVI